MKPFLVFLLTFTLEVHVYASPLQEPANCVAKIDVCAVGNDDERGFEVKVGESTVTLDRGASVIRKSSTEVRLVRGTIWVRGPLTVSSEFGSAKGADFWATKTSTELTAMAGETKIEISPRGSRETLTIDPGLQNTMGQIGFNGQAATGLPMPIPFKNFVLRWGRLYKGPKADFEKQVAEFHETWQAATQISVSINKALFDRKVASVDEAARAEAARRSKVESENRALREMFRKRNGL